MKNQKINRSILKCLLILLVMMGLTGCNSEENIARNNARYLWKWPIRKFNSYNDNVSTNQLLLPQCVVGNTIFMQNL